MGWDGSGWRLTRQDIATLERSSAWIRQLYARRSRFVFDHSTQRGLFDGRVCWDDLPPVQFNRRRRVRGDVAEVQLVVANEGLPDQLPVTMTESLWSALEGGRGVLTASLCDELAEIDESTSDSIERRLLQELGPRQPGQVRRRVVEAGRLDHGLLLGDGRELTLFECTFADCHFNKCEFNNVIFNRCNFSKCRFTACSFRSCVVIDCDWDHTNWGDWWSDEIMLRAKAYATDEHGNLKEDEDGNPVEVEESERCARTQIRWDSLNVVDHVRIEGYANSIAHAKGVGPAVFMPGRVSRHFAAQAKLGQRSFDRLESEHRAQHNQAAAEGSPLTLAQRRRLFRERERVKRDALWKVSRAAGAPQTNPADVLGLLRQRHGDGDLRGFEYAL